MAIVHHVMDEALAEVFERLQLQLKQPLTKSKSVQLACVKYKRELL